MESFKSPEFDDRVNTLIEEWHVSGLAIAVVENDLVASKGYGRASLSPEKPTTANNLFDIASSSNSLTAASVALLVADNEHYPLIQWDTVLSTLLLDDFVISGRGYTENITVEDILSHRTGLPRPRAAQPDTAQSVSRNLRNLKPAAPLRTKYMYNNIMFTVATHLIEQVTGLPFKDFLQKHFFDPLGMKSTNLLPSNAIAAGLEDRLITPYVWSKEVETFVPTRLQEIPEAQGAGSIITSVNDYIKWVKALMYQEHPVSTDVYKGLTKLRTFANPDNEPDKLDPYTSPDFHTAELETHFYRGYQFIGHDGGDPGVRSRHFFLPDVKFGAVILGSSDTSGGLINILAHELIDAALHVPTAERPDWNSREHEQDAADERESKDDDRERRSKLCPEFDAANPQPQKIPLDAYTGQYWNAGYKGMTMEIKNDQLFIDATDRTMGFTLTFEHLCSQTKYIAHMSDYYLESNMEVGAEFRFDNDTVVKMGLELEPDLEEYIWFDKVVEDLSLPVRSRQST